MYITDRPLQLLFLFLILFSCSNGPAFESEFEKSLDAWNNGKKINDNSYTYTVGSSSVFGFGNNTTLKVIMGKVVSRSYEAYEIDGSFLEIVKRWSENENDLGSHEEGAAAITLDQIYNACKTDILTVNKDDNFITFLTENDGLLSVCSYFPKNCQDDCSVGFNITAITWIEQ